jgi:hypothetical protein
MHYDFEQEKTYMPRTAVLVILASALLTASAISQEKAIKRAQLPKPVEATVAAQSQGAKVRGFSEEKEKGQTYYEAQFVVNGHSKDVLMDGDGKIVEVEEQVAMDALPAAVRDGLQAKAGKGRLASVESITKHDKLVAYEAKVITAGKHSEIQVGPAGQPLDHEE